MRNLLFPLMEAQTSDPIATTPEEQLNTFWERLGNIFADFGWRLIALIIVLIVGIILIRFVSQIIRKALLKTKLNSMLGIFFLSIIKFILYIILIFILAGIAGISMTPMITALAAAGLIIALAVQDTLSNIANGVLIIASKPFRIGDHVKINGVEGIIKAIRMTNTELLTANNIKIFIPNSRITADSIVNYTARPTRRVDMEFTISLPDDFDTVRDIVNDIMISDSRIFDDPSPEVKLDNFKDNSITFIARCWVKTGDYWDVYYYVIEKVYNELRNNGIQIEYSKIKLEMPKDNKEAE